MKRKRVSLDKLTTIRLKGDVLLGILDSENDFESLDNGFMIGCGSNILVKNRNVNLYKLSKKFSFVEIINGMLICGASLRISELIRFQLQHSISALEFLAGVPASVGGCIYMNAGAFSFEISDRLIYVKGFKKGRGIVTISRDDIDFKYRESGLDDIIILEAGFLYERKSRDVIENSIRENIKKRIKNAHLTNTFGSIFKNPKNLIAAKLIEDVGLKGLYRNSVCISNKHANFMVGKGLVDIDDALFLIDRVKDTVYKSFSVELEEEVKII